MYSEFPPFCGPFTEVGQVLKKLLCIVVLGLFASGTASVADNIVADVGVANCYEEYELITCGDADWGDDTWHSGNTALCTGAVNGGQCNPSTHFRSNDPGEFYSLLANYGAPLDEEANYVHCGTEFDCVPVLVGGLYQCGQSVTGKKFLYPTVTDEDCNPYAPM